MDRVCSVLVPTCQSTSSLSHRANRFARPPVVVVQAAILGKACFLLHTTLEIPCVDKAKAFKGMTQLAVLVRQLSETEH